MVFHPRRETQVEGVRKHGADENSVKERERGSYTMEKIKKKNMEKFMV